MRAIVFQPTEKCVFVSLRSQIYLLSSVELILFLFLKEDWCLLNRDLNVSPVKPM